MRTKTSMIVSAALAAGSFASVAAAEPLWQSFEIGAAKDAVLQEIPTAKIDVANSAGTTEMYRAEGVPEDGMWTYFTFDNGLRKVEMYGRGADNYLRVVDGLTRKYGRPTTSTQAASSGLSVWSRPTSKIVAKLQPSQRMGAGFVAHEPFTVTYGGATSSILDRGL